MPPPWRPSAPPSEDSHPISPRTRSHRPFSSFFNGTSILGGSTNGSQCGANIASSSHYGSSQPSPKLLEVNPPRLELPRLDMSHLYDSSVANGASPRPLPSQRSPTSTRSLIDPAISPELATARPLSSVTQRSPVSPLEGAEDIPSNPSRLALAHVLDYGGNVPLTQLPLPEDRQPRHHRLPSGLVGYFPSVRGARQQRRGEETSRREQGREREPRTQRSMRRGYWQRPSQGSGQRSTQTSSTRSSPQGRGPRWIPKHSKGKAFLFPAMASSAVRAKFFHCVLTGSILALVLITFFALSTLSPTLFSSFKVVLILFLLIFGVLLFHSLIRLSILIRRYNKYGSTGLSDSHLPPGSTGNGSGNSASRGPRRESYAHIERPIHVILARDEEMGIGSAGQDTRFTRRAGGSERDGGSERGSEAGTGEQERDLESVDDDILKGLAPPPPAYGLWRGSVRVDPNLLHWQRVEASAQSRLRPLSDASVGTVRRPPSYTSPAQYTREGAYF